MNERHAKWLAGEKNAPCDNGELMIYCHYDKELVRCGDCWPCQECYPCAECEAWPCPHGEEEADHG